jgi:hypothetical protein
MRVGEFLTSFLIREGEVADMFWVGIGLTGCQRLGTT